MHILTVPGQKNPTCCVSLSSFYNDTFVPCPTCSCGYKNNGTKAGSCVEYVLESIIFNLFSHALICLNSFVIYHHGTPLVQFTDPMCPVGIPWHVKLNYKDYWRVMITITNFNYHMTYTQRYYVVQNPNLGNISQLFDINYKSLSLWRDKLSI